MYNRMQLPDVPLRKRKTNTAPNDRLYFVTPRLQEPLNNDRQRPVFRYPS